MRYSKNSCLLIRLRYRKNSFHRYKVSNYVPLKKQENLFGYSPIIPFGFIFDIIELKIFVVFEFFYLMKCTYWELCNVAENIYSFYLRSFKKKLAV